MKLKLVFDTIEGKKTFCGYTITAENDNEVEQLSIIRDFYFWGNMGYGGRKDRETPTPEGYDVAELAFANRSIIKPGTFDSVWAHIKEEGDQ